METIGKIKIKNLDEYIQLLEQLKEIIEKINGINIEIEITQFSSKD